MTANTTKRFKLRPGSRLPYWEHAAIPEEKLRGEARRRQPTDPLPMARRDLACLSERFLALHFVSQLGPV